MSERIHLFANGTQCGDWTANNCDRCALSGDASEPGSSHCELFEAIADAGAGDGTVDPLIAGRLGYTDDRYVWPCPSFTREAPFDVLAERERAALAAWNAGKPIATEARP